MWRQERDGYFSGTLWREGRDVIQWNRRSNRDQRNVKADIDKGKTIKSRKDLEEEAMYDNDFEYDSFHPACSLPDL